jgi:membrane dipeptidase
VALIGVENAYRIGEDLRRVKEFYDRGGRYMSLAHNGNNQMSDSNTGERDGYTWKNGISPMGERVIAEMNRLGIMVDVSHISDEATRQAVALSRVPVIASHSALRHFTPDFERNLSDELAQLIASKGGVVQIPFGTAFVNPKAAANTRDWFRESLAFDRRSAERVAAGEPALDRTAFEAQWAVDHPKVEAPISDVLDQIDYAVKLVGVDHVGIGSDFDGVDGELPEGLRTVADFPNLVAGLQARGHSDADIRKILGGNLMRVWAEIEAGAGTP